MIRKQITCASCVQFDYQTHEEQAAHGIGLCTMPTGAPHVSPFVRHDARPCVLYVRVGDLASRRRFVEQQIVREAA